MHTPHTMATWVILKASRSPNPCQSLWANPAPLSTQEACWGSTLTAVNTRRYCTSRHVRQGLGTRETALNLLSYSLFSLVPLQSVLTENSFSYMPSVLIPTPPPPPPPHPHLTCSISAISPEAMGAAADVPVKLSVQPPRLTVSVVACLTRVGIKWNVKKSLQHKKYLQYFCLRPPPRCYRLQPTWQHTSQHRREPHFSHQWHLAGMGRRKFINDIVVRVPVI